LALNHNASKRRGAARAMECDKDGAALACSRSAGGEPPWGAPPLGWRGAEADCGVGDLSGADSTEALPCAEPRSTLWPSRRRPSSAGRSRAWRPRRARSEGRSTGAHRHLHPPAIPLAERRSRPPRMRIPGAALLKPRASLFAPQLVCLRGPARQAAPRRDPDRQGGAAQARDRGSPARSQPSHLPFRTLRRAREPRFTPPL